MLQKYTFIDKQKVNDLQKEVITFFKKIKSVTPADKFDPDLYFSTDLATKVKAKVKDKNGKLKNNLLYIKAKAFFDKFKTLKALRVNVFDLFIEMNKIPELFDNTISRVTIDDLPKSIRKESSNLFVYLYETTLTSYNVKKHYEEFYEAQGNNWCPFCGLETLSHFTHQKEDYDHLLAKSIYPFAAVNMRNLAPMGQKCNRTHKKAKDLIWDNVKQIKAVNPYSASIKVMLDFKGSSLPTRSKKGSWIINIIPNKEEVKRWDYIFNISDRIIKDHLANGKNPDYEDWLRDYINLPHTKNNINTIKKVRASLAKYASRFDHNRYRDKRYLAADLLKWISSTASDSFITSLMKTINK